MCRVYLFGGFWFLDAEHSQGPPQKIMDLPGSSILGFRSWNVGLWRRAQGLGFRAWGVRFRVLKIMVYSLLVWMSGRSRVESQQPPKPCQGLRFRV